VAAVALAPYCPTVHVVLLMTREASCLSFTSSVRLAVAGLTGELAVRAAQGKSGFLA